MGAALVFLLVGLGAMAAGVLIGRYYVPDDRQLRRTARHSRAYMRALSHLIARDHDAVVSELRAVLEENIEDTEPYFALGGIFRSRGEHERAIRVHQALAVRERDNRKLRQRAMYELGLDFRAAGMPRRATRAMEEVLLDEPGHEAALRVLAALYEEQARFNEAAGLWQRLGRKCGEDTRHREHHLLVAAAQAALGRADLDAAKQLLKSAQKHEESAHFFAAAAELARARGNHRGAKQRLTQALIAEPGLVPYLLPGLIAAEQALAATEAPGDRAQRRTDDLDDDRGEPPQLPAASTPQLEARAAGTVPVLAEIEAATGPRIELALVRTQLVAPGDTAGQAELAKELLARFPDSLAARVAAARLALAGEDPGAIRDALDGLVSDRGALAWALHGRWQCAHCGHRPGPFSWRCGQCRRWSTLRMETGVEAPPVPPRERRAVPRLPPAGGAGGTAPEGALPAPTLDAGLDAGRDAGLRKAEMASAGPRRSLLGRVGGWVSGVWRRDAL